MTFYAMYPPAGSSANASIGTNGATAPTSSTEVGGINPSGNLQPLQTDSSGNLLVSIGTEPATPLNTNIADYGGVATSLGQKAMAASIPVVIASDQSTINTLIPDETTTGTITSTQSVTAPISGYSSAGISISGTWTGTVILEGSVDGTNYYPVSGAVLNSGLISTSFSANNAFQTNVSGLADIRMRGNTVTSGTAIITIRINATTGGVVLTESLPQGGNTIGNVGITGTLPLPAGAATAANQTNGNQETQIVQGGNTATVTAAGALQVDGSAVTQPVSAVSLPLPTGASTSALQTTGNTTLSNIQANQTNGTQVTTISGTVPLPTGASTAALQSNVQSAIGTSATTAITVQGSASGVDLPVAIASSITIPISGVVIAQIKDSAGLSLNSNGAGALEVAVTGTTPVSGTVAVTQSTSPWVDNITQFGGTNISTGTGASGAGIPRVTVSNDSNILATQSGTWNITNVSGTISLPTGASTSALQSSVQGSATGGTAATSSQLAGGIYNSTPPTLTNGQQAALQFTSAGALVTSATSTTITSSTSTLTSVAAATSSTSLLASNTGRKGAYFFNDSTAILYLAFASSASTTAYTVQIASNGFYEMPNPAVYTGSIFGIWSAANGNVRITELS